MKKRTHLTLFILMLLVLAGCNLPQNNSEGTVIPISSQEPTVFIPSPTPTPALAATVNGEDILLSSYQTSLTQLETALAKNPELLAEGETEQSKVMLALIDRQILSQAAREAGFVVTEEMAAERLNQIIEDIGGNQEFADYLTANGFTDLTNFQHELNLEIEAAWQRELIAASIPQTAEQIEARQLLFYSDYLAQRAYGQLQSGASFDTVAANNDPKNLGYLGWFPRGYLLIPEVEDAAFALQPTQHSHVIETEAGYIILFIIKREADHPLSPDAYLKLQGKAVNDWLEVQRAQSQIEIHLP